MTTDSHWNDIYTTKSQNEVSWFQDPPGESLRLILKHSKPSDAVVDVGAGASLLVDHLFGHGYGDISIVDVSTVALDAVRQRLLEKGHLVTTYATDVTTWVPPQKFGVWHDRAVFHFLVTDDQQHAYVDTVARTIEPNGVVIIGAFGLTGPSSCSGLPVQRHSVESLADAFSSVGTLIDSSCETHMTPWGAEQDFVWTVIRAGTTLRYPHS